jgi:hypothetical protein
LRAVALLGTISPGYWWPDAGRAGARDEGADMSEGSGFGAGAGNDQPDGVVYASGSQRPGGGQEDGQPVGAADVRADRGAGGADEGDDGRMDTAVVGDAAERNTYDPLDDDVPLSEDGQGLGAADRDADIDRAR